MMGETLCHSVEEFKAWSQNLGHDGVLTTSSISQTIDFTT